MNSRDFLVLAQTLVPYPTEAAWRSAISRAYYAVFHVARELFQDLRFVVPNGEQAHGYLWLRLSNCGDPNVRKTGSEMKTLRTARNQADYDLLRKVSTVSAATRIQLAIGIIDVLEAAALEPTRTLITDAMRIYERDVLQNVTWLP